MTKTKTASLEAINTQVALIAQDITYIKKDVLEIKDQLSKDCATKEWVNQEYGQTKKVVNAILVTLGMAIAGAFATFMIRGGLK